MNITIELEPLGGIVIRWRAWTLLLDPIGVWVVRAGRVVWGARYHPP